MRYRVGDIPITRDQAPDVAGGAVVPERSRRLCIGSRALLHPPVPALLSARSGPETAARRKSALSPTPFGPLAATPFGSQHEAKSSRLRSAGETAPLPLGGTYHEMPPSILSAGQSSHLAGRPLSGKAVVSRHGAPDDCWWANASTSVAAARVGVRAGRLLLSRGCRIIGAVWGV